MDRNHQPSILPHPSTALPLVYPCQSCNLTFDAANRHTQHKSKMHSIPNPILMPDSSEVTIVQQPDGQLTCPVVDCPLRLHPTCTGYIRHLQKHNLKPITDRPGPAKHAAKPNTGPVPTRRPRSASPPLRFWAPLVPFSWVLLMPLNSHPITRTPVCHGPPPQPKGLRMFCFCCPSLL